MYRFVVGQSLTERLRAARLHAVPTGPAPRARRAAERRGAVARRARAVRHRHGAHARARAQVRRAHHLPLRRDLGRAGALSLQC